MPLSYAQITEVTCPNCNTSVRASIWLIVDAQEKPSLLDDIRNGTIHQVVCSRCRSNLDEIDAPLILYRFRSDLPVLFLPAKQTTAEEDHEHSTQLLSHLRDLLGNKWQDDWLKPLNWVSQEMARFLLLPEAANISPLGLGTLFDVALALSRSERWDEARRLVDENSNLLTPLADRIMAQLAKDQENELAKQHVEQARSLLARCRQIGVEEAFAERLSAEGVYREIFPDKLINALQAFMAPSTWQESRKVLEHLGDVLFNVQIDEVFAAALNTFHDHPEMKAFVEEHRTVLQRAKTDGIDAAFANVTERKSAPNVTRDTWLQYGVARPEEKTYQLPDDFLGVGVVEVEQAKLAQMIDAAPDSEISLLPEVLATLPQIHEVQRRIEILRWALTLLMPKELPVMWAVSKLNLAANLVENPAGDPVANIGEAMQHCLELLDAPTRQNMPQIWAEAQSTLGEAYRHQLLGDPGENIERSFVHYRHALEIFTRTAFPVQWATTQHVMGAAYSERLQGKRVANLEEAIACYQRALEIRTPQTLPNQWALTQANLGNAYADRIYGEPLQNQEEAIACYLRALSVFTPQNHPAWWAEIQNSLGITYRGRIRGDRAENGERAIGCLQRALEVWTYETAPSDWAKAHANLANAYLYRKADSRAANLEQAIYHNQQALKVFTSDSYPQDWAAICANLGAVYRYRSHGNRTENMAQAIQSLQRALTVYTHETNPERWATVQLNLAGIYAEYSGGERQENIQASIASYQHALSVFTVEAYPDMCKQATVGLGTLHFKEKNWPDAFSAFSIAIAAADQLYLVSATPEARQAELSTTTNLAASTAYCLARMERMAQAVEVLEQGLARTLSEALGRKAAALQRATPEDQVAFATVQARIVTLEAETRTVGQPGARNFLAISTELHQAREELSAIVVKLRQYIPDFMPERLPYAEINAVAVAIEQPLVYLLTTQVGGMALIVPPTSVIQSPPHPVWLDDFTADDLEILLYDHEGAYQQSYLAGIVSGEMDILESAFAHSWPLLQERVMTRVVAALQMLGHDRAVLIATGNFDLLPLPALALETGIYTFAPSARALRTAKEVVQDRSSRPPKLLGIGNPLPSSRSLPFAKFEVEVIASLFPSGDQHLLFERHASRSAVLNGLQGRTHLHFSCHGSFDPGEPLRSFLSLSGDDRITLRDLLDGGVDLSDVRLVVLSACQTGLSEFVQVPDEAVGFPAGFMQAGVPGILSTLWPVADIATAVLLARFYYYYLRDGVDIARSLHRSQIWLRNSTITELKLVDWLEKHYEAAGKRDRNISRAIRYYRSNPEIKPFAHPYYWAAFVFFGV